MIFCFYGISFCILQLWKQAGSVGSSHKLYRTFFRSFLPPCSQLGYLQFICPELVIFALRRIIRLILASSLTALAGGG
jgi:hypothetical protein